MQVTISVASTIALAAWTVGAALIGAASIGGWPVGWTGVAIMPIGTAAWLHHRMHREAVRMTSREDAAFNIGRESGLRSIR